MAIDSERSIAGVSHVVAIGWLVLSRIHWQLECWARRFSRDSTRGFHQQAQSFSKYVFAVLSKHATKMVRIW